MSLRRSTRAQSARMPTPSNTEIQGSPESLFDTAATPRRNASMRLRRSTTRRARSPDGSQNVVLREPKGADTPDMQSRFDNSYGNNSFMGLESASKRRGAAIRAGFDDEDEEDRRFQQQLRGKPGKYIGQNNLNDAIDETRKEAARETEPVEDAGDETLLDDGPDLSDPLLLDEPEPQAEEPEQSSPPKENPLHGQMLPPPLPASLMGNVPGSPERLDSSRSFNHETGLFEDATLRSPMRDPATTTQTPSAAPVRDSSYGLSPKNWLPSAITRSTLPYVRSSFRKPLAGLRFSAAQTQPHKPSAESETETNDTLEESELKDVMEIVLKGRGQLKDQPEQNFHLLDDLSYSETEEVVTYITQTGRSRAAARKLARTLPNLTEKLTPPEPIKPATTKQKSPIPVTTPLEPANEKAAASAPRRSVSRPRSAVPEDRRPRSRGSTPVSPSVSTFSDKAWQQCATWANRITSFFSIIGVFLGLALVSSLILMFIQAAVAPADTELSAFTNFKYSIAEYIPTPVQQILSDGDLGPIWSRLKQHDSAISKLSSDDASLRKTIESFKAKLPERIYVTTDKAGKPEIKQDFWHALRDKIKADDLIVTFENAKHQSPEISDALWRAVKSRLDADEVFRALKDQEGSKINAEQFEKVVDNKLTKSWETWKARNDAALQDLLANTAKGTAVQRDEFVALLGKEVSTYKREIQHEITAVNSRMAAFQTDFEKLANETPPEGVTRREVQTMINVALERLVSSGGLDAIANGQIRGHAASELFNQVNFFSLGSGAVIDPGLTSKPWMPGSSFKSKGYLERGGYQPQPASMVLKPWSEENECFCAAPSSHGSSKSAQNSVGVLLSRDIIPQHLVVENILPGATLNPGSTPRTIEVWAYIEEMNLRREVEAFSKTSFPNTPAETVLNEGFQKIGHFTYEQSRALSNNGGPLDNGMQIFKMSEELGQMGATTSHVVVRALDNYGADHTCFYRLRLYGEMPGDERRAWTQGDLGGSYDDFDVDHKPEEKKKGWFS